MMLGLGMDLVDVDAFGAQLEDGASVFRADAFTAAERRYAESAASGAPEMHLAARYAAKEATIKALDQSCAQRGVDAGGPLPLCDIEIARDPRGRPSLRLHGKAAALADRLGVDRMHLTLSHDGRYAAAVVACEALVGDLAA